MVVEHFWASRAFPGAEVSGCWSSAFRADGRTDGPGIGRIGVFGWLVCWSATSMMPFSRRWPSACQANDALVGFHHSVEMRTMGPPLPAPQEAPLATAAPLTVAAAVVAEEEPAPLVLLASGPPSDVAADAEKLTTAVVTAIGGPPACDEVMVVTRGAGLFRLDRDIVTMWCWGGVGCGWWWSLGGVRFGSRTWMSLSSSS